MYRRAGLRSAPCTAVAALPEFAPHSISLQLLVYEALSLYEAFSY